MGLFAWTTTNSPGRTPGTRILHGYMVSSYMAICHMTGSIVAAVLAGVDRLCKQSSVIQHKSM